MKRLFRILSISLLCGALSAPAITAQRHGGANNGGRERTTRTTTNNSRSNGNNRGGARPSARPNNGNNNGSYNSNHNYNTHNNGSRPGTRPNNNKGNKGHGANNWDNNNGHRPDNGFGNGYNRPNGNGYNRPNGNGHNRPNGNGYHPGAGNGHHNHGISHNHAGHRPTHLAPPRRPYRPNMYRPHYRPTPPPRWRPARGIPAIRGILGITFGTGISISLDYLYNSGYIVDGYANDVVYLRNVNQLNYIWTDAALYYGNRGLDASSFYYATPYYDMTRYNAVYNNLVALYGTPVAVNTAGQLGATWFGGNQGYITLSFGASNVAGGALRYLTTLTFGL